MYLKITIQYNIFIFLINYTRINIIIINSKNKLIVKIIWFVDTEIVLKKKEQIKLMVNGIILFKGIYKIHTKLYT